MQERKQKKIVKSKKPSILLEIDEPLDFQPIPFFPNTSTACSAKDYDKLNFGMSTEFIEEIKNYDEDSEPQVSYNDYFNNFFNERYIAPSEQSKLKTPQAKSSHSIFVIRADQNRTSSDLGIYYVQDSGRAVKHEIGKVHSNSEFNTGFVDELKKYPSEIDLNYNGNIFQEFYSKIIEEKKLQAQTPKAAKSGKGILGDSIKHGFKSTKNSQSHHKGIIATSHNSKVGKISKKLNFKDSES